MSQDTFKVATWNMAGGTDHPPSVDTLEPILLLLLRKGVTLLLLQEAQGDGVRDMLRRNGLEVEFARPQYAVAWLPDAWPGHVDSGSVSLADTLYGRPGHEPTVDVDAAWAVLADWYGRTLAALSYHLAPHVQVLNPPERRMLSTREVAVAWRRLTTGVGLRPGEPDLSWVAAVLFGGDDNVDSRRAFARRFRFLERAATGLREIIAPAATHGGGRRIDDFRVWGLDELEGEVVNGGGDHKIHVREFRWSPRIFRRRRTRR